MVKGAQTRLCVFVLMASSLLPRANSHGLDGEIRKYIFNDNGLGTYSFEYETSDGSFRKEDGGVVANSLVVRGEYGYIDPSGRLHIVKYVADSNGFQPHTNDDEFRFNDRRIL